MHAARQRAVAPRARRRDDVEDPLAGFDARLAERTEVSMAREFELAALPASELHAEAHSLRCLLDRFASVVAAAHDARGVARGFLQRLDLKFISRDHDWRSVFAALAGGDDRGEPYLVVALARYRQYLENRASLVARLIAAQDPLADTAEVTPPPRAPRLVRLPARRPVLVSLVYRGELALWLGGHRFGLHDGFPPELSDPSGENVWPLQRRGLVIGRHTESDIVVDARLEQVSRAHAVLEWPGYTRVIVIDLSSNGTYLERRPHGLVALRGAEAARPR